MSEAISADEELRTRQLRGSTLAVLGARALSKGHDDAFLHETLAAMRRLLGLHRARILEVDADGKLALRAASPDDHVATLPSGGGSLAGYTVLAQAAVVVEDVDTERRFDTALLASDTRSAIAAPVFGPEGVRGVLTGQSSMPCAFDSGAVDFIQSLANIVGTALK